VSLLRTLTVNSGYILVPLIDAYQSAGKFPPTWDITINNEKQDDGYFHPSTDAIPTPLQLFQSKKKLAPYQKIGKSLRRTFDAGHMWHGYYGNILADMGLIDPKHIELHTEVPISTKYGDCMAAGTGDLVGVDIPGKGSWLVDMKTMRKDEFESGPTPTTFAKWEAQVNIYGEWFSHDQMMILAIQKDSPHDLREYRIERKKQLVIDIYNKWGYVKSCIDTNTIPDNDFITIQ
jgi:hypothetical protein